MAEKPIKNHHADELKDITRLLEEIAEDNMNAIETLSRVREGQDSLHSDLSREIGRLRDEWTNVLQGQALSALCAELLTPLAALESLLQHLDRPETQTVLGHVGSIAFTLRNILRRQGVEKIPVVLGREAFNPALHSCVRLLMPEESPFPGALSRTIVRIVEDGYTLGARVLIPVKVEVQADH